MSYNKLNNLNLSYSQQQNNDDNNIIYLDNISNNVIKSNYRFVFKKNATAEIKESLLENFTIIIKGNLKIKNSFYFNNLSLKIVNLNEKFEIKKPVSPNANNKNLFFIAIQQLNNLQKSVFKSSNLIVDSQKSIKSNEIIGQLINNISGNKLVRSSSTNLNVEVKEKNNKKYFELSVSSNSNSGQSSFPLISKVYIKSNSLDNSQTTVYNNQSQFISTFSTGSIKTGQLAKKSRHYLGFNENCQLWNSPGKTVVFIDTSDVDNILSAAYTDIINGAPDKSRYEMFIDLNRDLSIGDWQKGNEITFIFKQSSLMNDSITPFYSRVFNTDTALNPLTGNTPDWGNTAFHQGNLSTNTNLLQKNVKYVMGENYTSNITPIYIPFLYNSSNYTYQAGDFFIFENQSRANYMYIYFAIVGQIGGRMDIGPGNKIIYEIKAIPDTLNSWPQSISKESWFNIYTNGFDVTNITTENTDVSQFLGFLEKRNDFLNAKSSRYQTIISFPKNHSIFTDVNIVNNVFALTPCFNSFESAWTDPYGSSVLTLNKTYSGGMIDYSSVPSIDQKPGLGIEEKYKNCLFFSGNQMNNSSFTLKFLGYNNGKGLWVVK